MLPTHPTLFWLCWAHRSCCSHGTPQRNSWHQYPVSGKCCGRQTKADGQTKISYYTSFYTHPPSHTRLLPQNKTQQSPYGECTSRGEPAGGHLGTKWLTLADIDKAVVHTCAILNRAAHGFKHIAAVRLAGPFALDNNAPVLCSLSHPGGCLPDSLVAARVLAARHDVVCMGHLQRQSNSQFKC